MTRPTLLGASLRAAGSLRGCSRRAFGRVLIALGSATPRPLHSRAGRGHRRAVLRAVGLLATGHDDEARAWARSAGHAGDPRARLAMAAFLGELKDWREALELLRPEPPAEPLAVRLAWLRARARAARRVGRYGEARRSLEAALALGPVPAGRALLDERRRIDQVVARFSEIPVVARRPPARDAAEPGRILHLVERSPLSGPSGYTVRTQQVTRAQQGAGLDPHVLAIEPEPVGTGAGRGGDGTVEGIAYHWSTGAHRASVMTLVEAAERAAAVVDRIRPAALHPATPPTVGNLGRALARWSGLPMVYEVRGFREDFWLLRHGETDDVDHYVLTRDADTACMVEAAAVVTLGEAMRAEIVARGVDPGRVEVIPNAVDVRAFRPGDRDPELAASLGIGPDEVVIGYISSFQPYEDFATIVDAVAELRSRGRAVRGLLVGDGGTWAATARRVSRLGLRDTIVMPGRVPHHRIARYHRLIDVFVAARRTARISSLVTPLKPLEAMASGRAVVVSRLPALCEIVVESETGMVCEPEDPRQLADILDRLVVDATERRRLGAAARAWVERERTVERTGVAYRALYERIGVPLPRAGP